FYHKQSEAGIRYDDVSLNIDWKVEPDKAIISEKDKLLPLFKDCTTNFDF
ncbi:MAG: dTDP-4-dehydrorhamnose 3,5-epimerase family protein, partial [Flavisolibacter sp.]|nr:dTDP-4-dehydrorhamnose 3,5-epimerase family protein [Flavisolibacter sp.]